MFVFKPAIRRTATAVLACCVLLSGCSDSGPAYDSIQSAQAPVSSSPASSAPAPAKDAVGIGRSSSASSASIPPEALNEQGQIVLGSLATDDNSDEELAKYDNTGQQETGQQNKGKQNRDDATTLVLSGSSQNESQDDTDLAAKIPALRVSDSLRGETTESSTTDRKNQTIAPPPNPLADTVGGLPPAANVATEADRNQKIAEDWPKPQAVIFVSGEQHGYIEPCGCTGLDLQKGGLIRRDTLLTSLRDRGWEIVPVDVGNQVRRIGRQPELKFQTTVESMKMMNYKAVTLGRDDLKLSSIELIQMAGSDGVNELPFISSNVVVWGDANIFPAYRIAEAGGRKIGITAYLSNEYEKEITSSDIEIFNAEKRLQPIVKELQDQGCDYLVLLAHASLQDSADMARKVPGFDLVVTAGGFGEPTLKPEPIDGSQAVMVQVGTKGMYGGIVGLFDDKDMPVRYQKIAISSQFKDSERMLDEFAKYQERLQQAGFTGLGIDPIAHPSGRKYVGSEVCGDCHTTAYEIWENSPHIHATDSIVAANNERGGIPRHHDPECISCHATGWDPQGFYPYESGFLSPEKTPHLVASGCENCHGPGKDHVDAEYGDIEADNDRLLELRQQMIIKLADARDKCLECHDLDNSPDFHVEGAFQEYWEQVKHYGKD